MKKTIYLDYNATTPIAGEVAEAMWPYLDTYFGNPSSSHEYGTVTKQAVEKARQQVAGLLHCQPSEIVFTSGGTEANNMAIKGIALANRHRGNHIITSAVEHPAVLEVCRYLEQNGFSLTVVPVDGYGLVNVAEVEKAITPKTILITIMHANNEVGTLQPIAEIGKLAGERKVFFHTDAAQSVAKVEVDVQKMGVDLLSVAGHKLYAPKGVGALFIKQGTILEKLMHGAAHEHNRRAGTENVLEIVGLGKAAEIAQRDLDKNRRHLFETRELLFQLLKNTITEIHRNGHPIEVLPNTLSISFPGVDASAMISQMQGIAVSAGAACHADGVRNSGVLEAMKVPVVLAQGTLRVSTGRETTNQEIESAVQQFAGAYSQLKS
ncbi:MAG: cysteine desulfurase [Salinivirgaceae bacterium]|nr:cysteine desulfurase [Salinivirgaceae bacterium]